MQPTTKQALIVRGGWDGHSPVAATDLAAETLRRHGYAVTVSDTLDSYLDADALAATDLVVQCWTMGTITSEQVAGLRAAVAAGTGLAGWHGGIADSFRSSTEYLQLVGGQFAAHPGGIIDYTVEVVPERADHPVVAGFTSVALTSEQYWVLSDARNDVLATTTLAPAADGAWTEPFVSPAVWTRTWGAGRISVCTVGHQVSDLQVPEIAGIVERGMLWASR